MKKPSLAVLIGTPKKQDDESEDDAPSSGEMSGHKLELAKEILAAVKADDAGALAKALCAMVDVHGAPGGESDEEYDEEDDGADEE